MRSTSKSSPSSTLDLPPVVTLRAASVAVGLSPLTLRRRIKAGELSALRTREGRGGKLLLRREDIARFLDTMAG